MYFGYMKQRGFAFDNFLKFSQQLCLGYGDKTRGTKHRKVMESQKNTLLFVRRFYVHTQQSKFLAHIVRAPQTDPIRQCTLQNNTPCPYEVSKRSVGRPRNNWAYKTYERVLFKNTYISKDMWKADGRR